MDSIEITDINDDHGNSTVRPIKSDEGAVDLAERIVGGIAEDFRQAYQMYLESATEKELRQNELSLAAKEKLVRSHYFSTLSMSQLSPDVVITSLKLQVEKEIEKKAKRKKK